MHNDYVDHYGALHIVVGRMIRRATLSEGVIPNFEVALEPFLSARELIEYRSFMERFTVLNAERRQMLDPLRSRRARKGLKIDDIVDALMRD